MPAATLSHSPMWATPRPPPPTPPLRKQMLCLKARYSIEREEGEGARAREERGVGLIDWSAMHATPSYPCDKWQWSRCVDIAFEWGNSGTLRSPFISWAIEAVDMLREAKSSLRFAKGTSIEGATNGR